MKTRDAERAKKVRNIKQFLAMCKWNKYDTIFGGHNELTFTEKRFYFTVQVAEQHSKLPFFIGTKTSSNLYRYIKLDKTCTTHRFLLTIFPHYSWSDSQYQQLLLRHLCHVCWLWGAMSLLRGSPGLFSSSSYWGERAQHPYEGTSFLFPGLLTPQTHERRQGQGCRLIRKKSFMLMSAYWAPRPASPPLAGTATLTQQPLIQPICQFHALFFQSSWLISQNKTWL